MKRYYEGHESVYQKLAAEGVDCWGKDDFENAHMLGFLQSALAMVKLDKGQGLRALVIGCGTGPMACALSKQGYEVNGFDISPTAIEIAKKQAQKRGLDINYWVGDLCRDPIPPWSYDLILDSHCLHCIVSEADRKIAFQSICRGLTDEGVFILETMMGSCNSNGVSTDENGIVWTSYGEQKPQYEPHFQKNGIWYVPQRRLRPTKKSLDEELNSNGFQVVWSNEVQSETAGENGDYQAICRAIRG